jgi:hypothetical protein
MVSVLQFGSFAEALDGVAGFAHLRFGVGNLLH